MDDIAKSELEACLDNVVKYQNMSLDKLGVDSGEFVTQCKEVLYDRIMQTAKQKADE